MPTTIKCISFNPQENFIIHFSVMINRRALGVNCWGPLLAALITNSVTSNK